MTLLQVTDLRVEAPGSPVLRGVSFSIGAGERVGLIGESGSGKTMAALAVMGLVPGGLTVHGSIRLEGRELVGLGERRYSELRGDRVAMVFQEPMTALDPLMRVGRQIQDAIRLHRRLTRGQTRERMLELMARVGFANPREQARRFPHQLSGGQRQRIVIAIALACDPALILADEPTTALDVTVQAQVLVLLQRLVAEQGSALLLISHDLAVVSSVCERVLVMYGGTLVEAAPTPAILSGPRHPYTLALLQTSAAISAASRAPAGHLATIPGSVPALGKFPAGCVFRGRCPREQPHCQQTPPLTGDGHQFACWYPVDPARAADLRVQGGP